MKLLFCILVPILVFTSCISNIKIEDPDKLFLKKIETPNIKLEWYFHSLITSTTSDYVVLVKDDKTDTICVSDNIYDVNVFSGDTIQLIFYGQPSLYLEKIEIEQVVLGCPIIIDTTAIWGVYTFRKSFKEKKN
ncbi:MAG: hypothetical protein KBB11_01115 [Bacteroidales bacterium]|nr:hypothetical protein [Bacteroidales bacterium]